MKRDFVLIGGSAGSLDALRGIVRGLSPDFPAAVFVIQHLSARSPSQLPAVLQTAASMRVLTAEEGMRPEPGHIYVAPPDRHVLLAQDHMHVARGPKEGLHRPSINATFRSAAHSFGRRVIGVLLSGMLDDGASGLWEIAKNGGVAIVQDPEEAPFPSMPLNAMMDAPVHFRLKAHEIAPELARLVNGSQVMNALGDHEGRDPGQYSGFSCPECHGPLTRRDLGETTMEFRCQVGHRFSPMTLLEEHTSTQERRL